MQSLTAKRQFIHELRKRWKDAPDPYDPVFLWELFGYYWKFLKAFADPRLTEATPEQWKAYELHVKETETCDVRTRRGGKSLLLANLTFFFAIIQFGRYQGKVIYRAVFDKQLVQYKEWCRKNPFYVKFSEKDRDYGKCMYIVDSIPASVDELSEGSTASLGGSVLLLDEGGKAKSGQVKDQYCRYARGMVVEGEYHERRIIHASTPSTNTYFEEIYLFLRTKEDKDQRQYIITIPYHQCHWITEDVIQAERELNLNAPWVVPQEFECEWLAHGGNFFDQDHLKILGRKGVPINLFDQKNLTPSSAGLDWNGKLVGHILYEIYWDGFSPEIYVMNETKLDEVTHVKAWMDAHPHIPLEVEGQPKRDGFNAGFSDYLLHLGAQCAFQSWSDEGVKDQRLAILQRAIVYVHPRCKWFISNYQNASYDPTSLLPKLKKTPDQHGMDAVLHAIFQSKRIVVAYNTLSLPERPTLDAYRPMYPSYQFR